MTRQHFKALAEQIAGMPVSDECRKQAALAVARACRQFNPSFNEDTFLVACGVGDA